MLLHARRSAVSLIELIVVTGVIGVLVGITLPAVQSIRQNAILLKCQNNMKQIGLALHHYHDIHNRLPPERPATPAPGQPFSNDPNQSLSWMALILAEMDQEAVYVRADQACRIDPISYHNPPHAGFALAIPAYVCPADDRLLSPLRDRYGAEAAFTSYVGCAGYRVWSTGVIGPSPGIRLFDIADGTSQTLMVCERPPPTSLQSGRWYANVIDVSSDLSAGPDNQLAEDEPYNAHDLECRLAQHRYGPGRLSNPCDRYHFGVCTRPVRWRYSPTAVFVFSVIQLKI